MKRFRLVFLPFSLSFALMGGCTIRIGSDFSLLGEDNGSSGVGTGSGTAPIPRLPTPDVWRVDPPFLDAEQQQKQDVGNALPIHCRKIVLDRVLA